MKKLLVVLLLFSCSFTSNNYYATTWDGTASNQAITNEAMYDGVYYRGCVSFFIQNSTNPTFDNTGANRLKLVTKDSFAAKGYWTNLNTSFPAYSNKTGKQLIIKSDISISFSIQETNGGGYVCDGVGSATTIYTNASCTGTAYTNTAMTTAFVGNGGWYISTVGVALQINSSGTILSVGCPC